MLKAGSLSPHTSSSAAASDLLGFAEMQNLPFLPGISLPFTPFVPPQPLTSCASQPFLTSRKVGPKPLMLRKPENPAFMSSTGW